VPKPYMTTEPCINPVEYAAQIIYENEGFIRWVIRRQNNTTASEDDLFQDFYLKLIANPVPEDVKNIKGYLYKALINHLAISYHHTSMYEKKIEKFRKKSKNSVHKFDPTRALLIREEMNKMCEFIKEISPGQRYVAITLRYRDGCSIQEVADKMGLQYSSVKKYISIGLRKVRKCLNNT
jgi:RNA polymerase sigma factor (sigma-70 family)